MRLATVKEAVAYSKWGTTKLYDRINSGAIKAFKLGRKTVIDLDSVDAALESELEPIGPRP
jgi:excisionase family DNA binding protein